MVEGWKTYLEPFPNLISRWQIFWFITEDFFSLSR